MITKNDESCTQINDGAHIDTNNSNVDDDERHDSELRKWSAINTPKQPNKPSEIKLPDIRLPNQSPSKSKQPRMKDSDSGFVKCITQNGNSRDEWQSILSYINIAE